MKTQLDIETTMLGSAPKSRSLTRHLPWLLSVAAIAGLLLLIVAIHRDSPRTLISFHGYLHAAIAERFLTSDSPIPPENPFYAGKPLPYYWFFHFLAAQISRWAGWNVFLGLEALVLAGTALLCIACLLLGQRLFGRVAAGLLIAYLVFAGTNPFGIVIAGLKVLTQGTARLRDDPNFLWNVVHPVYNLVRYNDIGGLYGPLVNFLLNMTSRPLAMGALMMSLLCLQWALTIPRIVPLASLALTFALTSATSPIIGFAAGGVLCMFLLLFAVAPAHVLNRFSGATRGIRKVYLAAFSAIAAGVIIASPTFLHLLTGSSANRPHFYLFSTDGVKHLITLALSVGLLLLLAGIGYIKSSEENRGFFRLVLLGALALLLADAAILLPSGNQSNFFHAAVVFLAIPAAASVVVSARRFSTEKNLVNYRGAVGIVLVFLPTTVVLLMAYIGRPTLPVDFEALLPRRLPSESSLAQLYEWAQRDTSTDAVFVLNPDHRVATNGNVLEFPAMTNRAIFTESPGHYMAPYPDADWRYQIAIQLTSGGDISRADQQYLNQLHRPIYIVVDEVGDAAKRALMQQRYGPPVFHSQEIQVFRHQPGL